MLYARVDAQTKEILEYPLHDKTLRPRLLDMNISVPEDLKTLDMRSLGYYQVTPTRDAPSAPPGYRTVLAWPEWQGDELVRTWTVVPIDEDFSNRLWKGIRKRRNQLLKESDWTEMPSVRAVRSEAWAQEWDTYRQALRDITKVEYPTQVIFPRKPNDTE